MDGIKNSEVEFVVLLLILSNADKYEMIFLKMPIQNHKINLQKLS